MRIVFVSGWAHPANALEPLAELLGAGNDCRLLSVPMLDAEPGPLPRALADVVGEETGPCAVIGWSTGAVITLDMLARGNAEPTCVALIAATARFCSTDGYPHGLPAPALRAMRTGIQTRPEETLTAFFRECALPRTLPDIVIEHRVEDATARGPDALARGLDYLAETDLREALPGIATPVLVMHGKEDRIIPADAGSFVAGQLPSAQVILYDGVGHDLPAARCDVVAADIAHFLHSCRIS